MFTKRAFVGLLLAFAALLSVFDVWTKSQTHLVVDALSDHLESVSYAPYRRSGQTPLDPTTTIDPRDIDSDMKLLSQRFDCVRTYSVSQGLHAVPEAAARHGMKVLLGIWIGRNKADNELELNRAIAIAKANRNAIKAIIVGNEVLLRAEQPAEILRSYIDRVRTAVPGIPITYADVWEFWLEHRELQNAVDFVTIHILPYWEDRPVPIDDAVGHVSHIYQHVVHELNGKPVMIGETGWPSQGRRRQGAEPSLFNQARFIREFAVRATLEKIPYNVIEAFDQPWKRVLEGAAGGYWGLYDVNDTPKFPFRGPIAEAPGKIYLVITAAVIFFVALLWRWRERYSADAVLGLFAVSVIAGNTTAGVWMQMASANRDLQEWGITGVYALLHIMCVLYLGPVLVGWCANGTPLPSIAPVSKILKWIRRNDQSYNSVARGLGLLRISFLFGSAFVCLVLLFDPRYRDFPLVLYAPAAIGYSLMAWLSEQIDVDLEEIFLAVLIVILTIAGAISEHLITPRQSAWHWADHLNPYALLWSGTALLLAGAVLGPIIVKLRPSQSQTA